MEHKEDRPADVAISTSTLVLLRHRGQWWIHTTTEVEIEGNSMRSNLHIRNRISLVSCSSSHHEKQSFCRIPCCALCAPLLYGHATAVLISACAFFRYLFPQLEKKPHRRFVVCLRGLRIWVCFCVTCPPRFLSSKKACLDETEGCIKVNWHQATT